MKNRVSIEIEAGAIGRAFAHTDDHAQSRMINEMAIELKALCKGNYEGQVCAISRLLSNNGKKLVRDLCEFIDIRENDDNS